MLIKSLFSLSVLALSIAACGSPSSSESLSHTGQASTGPGASVADPAFTSCAVDDDCVATKLAAPGCCDNGWLVAVRSDAVQAYDDANTCSAPLVCPHYMVNDTRVAHCGTSNACELANAPAATTDDDAGTDTTSN